MHNILRTKLLLASALFVASVAATAQPTQIVGPIDALLAAEGKIQVIGQTLKIGPATQIAARGRLYSGSSASALLTAGRFVSVEAEQNPDSLTAKFISVLNAEYVPGSTAAYVSGRVDAISSSNGTVQIGNLVIDISVVAPEVVSSIAVGSEIEVIGIQPVARGPLVSAEILSIGGSGIESIGGSGVQSIGGSGIQSIGGSGIQSIGGSGIQSIGGSGIQSIGGSGIQSIGGSGIQSIGGSGIQSIGGSGIQSIGGSGIQSIGGSGIQSIGGSGIQSIGGSGIQSIGESSVQRVAAGAENLSIGGSGAQ